MLALRRCTSILLMTFASLIIPRLAFALPNQASFHSCGYKNGAWRVAQTASTLISSAQSLSSDEVRHRISGVLQQLSSVDKTYHIASSANARVVDTALRKAMALLTEAMDGRDLGVSVIVSSSIQSAWAQMNQAWRALNPMCALGHPSRVQEDVSADGNDYDGVGAFPVASPWLSLPQTWTLRWSYNCAHRPTGFKIEVRSIPSSMDLAETNGSVYLGPLLGVPVDQRGKAGAATQRLRGVRGQAYLVVRTRCTFSIRVVG